MNNIPRDENGVVDLGAFRKQKEEQQQEEAEVQTFQHIASQIQREIIVETEGGEEMTLKVLLSAVTHESVFLMLEMPSETDRLFMTIPHDGTTLKDEMCAMTQEEFEHFKHAVRNLMPTYAGPSEEEANDPGIIE